uniref:Uncharacterized protein n=1 Tax=Phytophthora ramorum TaxID=164328 RepID=H3HCM6_PHYRM
MCRAIFILLAHPLQTLTRMRWGAQLTNHLIAQCYLANKSSSSTNGVDVKRVVHDDFLQTTQGLLQIVTTYQWLRGGSATTSPKAYRRSCEISENIVYYTGLLTSHFQGMLACPELTLRESLDFFQHELFPTMDQIASQSARLQILWIGVRLHRNYAAHVPFEVLVRELQHETGRLFTAIWNDDDEMEGATFDNGLLGCGDTGEDTPANRKRAGDANTVDTLMVLGDCITLLAQFQPNTQPQFIQMCEKMIAALSASGSSPAATSQQYRIFIRSEVGALFNVWTSPRN